MKNKLHHKHWSLIAPHNDSYLALVWLCEFSLLRSRMVKPFPGSLRPVSATSCAIIWIFANKHPWNDPTSGAFVPTEFLMDVVHKPGFVSHGLRSKLAGQILMIRTWDTGTPHDPPFPIPFLNIILSCPQGQRSLASLSKQSRLGLCHLAALGDPARGVSWVGRSCQFVSFLDDKE